MSENVFFANPRVSTMLEFRYWNEYILYIHNTIVEAETLRARERDA